MYISRILYPLEVLGPGRRVGIWTEGCTKHCEGCSNPELWNKKHYITIPNLLDLIQKITEPIDGFTITGGDPLEQPDELSELTKHLCKISKDILVYTGYTFKEVRNLNIPLDNIAVLIDGRYIASRNINKTLCGSDNQQIIILNDKFRELYTNYLNSESNKIQNFIISSGYISAGIHRPDFKI